MALEGSDSSARVPVPEDDCPVSRARGEKCAIRGDDDAVDPSLMPLEAVEYSTNEAVEYSTNNDVPECDSIGRCKCEDVTVRRKGYARDWARVLLKREDDLAGNSIPLAFPDAAWSTVSKCSTARS